MNEIKKAKSNIAKCLREQNIPSEIMQLILQSFIQDIEIGMLNAKNRALQGKIIDLEKEDEEIKNDEKEENDDD